jgi:hypothetical protein
VCVFARGNGFLLAGASLLVLWREKHVHIVLQHDMAASFTAGENTLLNPLADAVRM